MCDNPGCQHGATFFQDQNALIERYGFSTVGVLGDNEGPGFIYTVGLSEKGMADIIFIGSSNPASVNYVALAAMAQLDGAALEEGVIPASTGINEFQVPIALVSADHLADSHAFSSKRRLDSVESDQPVRIMQVIMPDLSGRFPWEDGYDWLDQQVTANPFG